MTLGSVYEEGKVMKKLSILGFIFTSLYLFAASGTLHAQETFTGTVLRYGTGRYVGTRTSGFTLKLNSVTPDDEARRFLSILQTGGQDDLLDAIKHEDLGYFELTAGLGQRINAAREVNVGGMRKIYAVFERWTQFAELRGGYRSLDYPFGYIELTIDPRTGKGTGQYFAAAKIRWKNDKKGVGPHIEVEDYATIPAKLLNVRTKVKKVIF
jgi:hypothetical protein